MTDSCSYSPVKNGAQELDCGVVVDLEGRKLDAPLPECVEADVHAGGDRIWNATSHLALKHLAPYRSQRSHKLPNAPQHSKTARE
eukprot:4490589-Pleurochrysis_carterae.AAC.1